MPVGLQEIIRSWRWHQ